MADGLDKQSSKARLEAEVRRLEQVIHSQNQTMITISSPAGSPLVSSSSTNAIVEGVPPMMVLNADNGSNAMTSAVVEGIPPEPAAGGGGASEAEGLTMQSLLLQLDTERRQRHDAEEARRVIEEERTAAQAALARIEAEVAQLRAMLMATDEGALAIRGLSLSPPPIPAAAVAAAAGLLGGAAAAPSAGDREAAGGGGDVGDDDDLRSSLVVALQRETMEQTVARLRRERDDLAAAAAAAVAGSPSMVAQCFQDRSVSELRQMLSQLGGAQVTDLLALSPAPGRSVLEREYSGLALQARAEPRWVHDGAAKRCMLCNEEFGLRRRRHHCRCCGWVACSECCSGSVDAGGLEQWFGDDGTVVMPSVPGAADGDRVAACASCEEAVLRGASRGA